MPRRCANTGRTSWPGTTTQSQRGSLEGANTKIKLLQRQAFDFRDKEFFKLRLPGLHCSQHAFVG
ncbi:transposase [Planctellipticum variicoloris]|uniref:transposase n=1 Tax=Planctellipticum variicoloris TaxID=3064265 RepID=UPI003AF6C820